MKKSLLWALIPLSLISGLFFAALTQAYDTTVDSCGYVSGISEDDRLDFDMAEWSKGYDVAETNLRIDDLGIDPDKSDFFYLKVCGVNTNASQNIVYRWKMNGVTDQKTTLAPGNGQCKTIYSSKKINEFSPKPGDVLTGIVDATDLVQETNELDNQTTTCIASTGLGFKTDDACAEAGQSADIITMRSMGKTLADANRVCFDDGGEIYGTTHRYAWLPEYNSYVDFSWPLNAPICTTNPSFCTTYAPTVDLGTGYWSGYVWGGSTLKWIRLDWSCSTSCDTSQRVHTDLETGVVSGYGWNNTAGYINFGNSNVAVWQDLPEEPDPVGVEPIVELVPNRYGAIGPDIPVADGVDEYQFQIKLWDLEESIALDDDYAISVTVDATGTIYTDQIHLEGDAIMTDDEPTYSASDEAFLWGIQSLAPTSNANGLDMDEDGTIDYCYDYDASERSGFTRSCDTSSYTINSITVEVTDGPTDLLWEGESSPWTFMPSDWNAGSEYVDLEFAPAVEVQDLVYVDSDTGDSEYYIPTMMGEEFYIDGELQTWSEGDGHLSLDNIELDVNLNSSDYNFLMDTTGDDNYIPGEDYWFVYSDFSLPNDGDSVSIGAGSEGVTPNYVMLVDDSGYVAVAKAIIKRSLWARTWDRVKAASPSFKVAALGALGDFSYTSPGDITASTSFGDKDTTTTLTALSDFGATTYVGATIVTTGGPDLVVTNIYRDDSTDQLVIEQANQGDVDVTDLSGHTYIWIDGALEWTYSWSTLTDQSFLNADGSAELRPQVISGDGGEFTTLEHEVEVCIDYNDVSSETNENNNCTTGTVLSVDASELPDLKVSNLYKDSTTGQLVVEMENEGGADVTDLSGHTYIWIDGVLEWTYSWSTLSDSNRAFLLEGQSSTITPQTLYGESGEFSGYGQTVQACVDYHDVVLESDEDDNCLSVDIVEDVDASLLYDTHIYYTATGDDGPVSIEYYSAYLPILSEDGIEYSVPAYDLKQDGAISGTVTSSTADLTVDGDSDLVVVGDVDSTATRNELYQRFAMWTKGASSTPGTVSGAGVVTGGTELADNLYYFEGDVVVNLEEGYDEMLLVVNNGNVFVNSNIPGPSAFGAVVFSEGVRGGNVYIHPDVTDMVNFHVYTDGSVLSYDGTPGRLSNIGYRALSWLTPWTDDDERNETLSNQLYWTGSVISSNTIGGVGSSIIPGGDVDADLAPYYDFFYLRSFTLCWVQTEDGIPVDIDGDGDYMDGDTPDYGDMEDCGFERSENLYYDASDIESSDNAPFYFEYVPVSSTLPILGADVTTGVQ